eukprot:5604292-Prymnesium_polylepis.1
MTTQDASQHTGNASDHPAHTMCVIDRTRHPRPHALAPLHHAIHVHHAHALHLQRPPHGRVK